MLCSNFNLFTFMFQTLLVRVSVSVYVPSLGSPGSPVVDVDRSGQMPGCGPCFGIRSSVLTLLVG